MLSVMFVQSYTISSFRYGFVSLWAQQNITNLVTSRKRNFCVNNVMAEYDSLLQRARNTVPPLSPDLHKGQAGRIGIIGGSYEYCGAPYFAAISALKVGADLAYVFCPEVAAPAIKNYSPELIVIPLEESPLAVSKVEQFLERLHVLVVGPGLGRDSKFLLTVIELMKKCRELEKPLIIDADGLNLIKENLELVKNYKGVILTPNAIEFLRLFGDERNHMTMFEKLGDGVTVIEKGLNDRIYNSSTMESYECPAGGSGRRCGGQGDLLSGALATFYCWALQSKHETSPALVASFAASYLTKWCNRYAFEAKGRSMLCSDMIEQIHRVFQDHFEHRKE